MIHNYKIENISTTTRDNGFIDPKGRFYGCGLCDHIYLAEFLGKKFNFFNPDAWNPYTDVQIWLDDHGWVKIKESRFYWGDNIHPTKKQVDAIFDYLINKNMKYFTLNDKKGTIKTLIKLLKDAND